MNTRIVQNVGVQFFYSIPCQNFFACCANTSSDTIIQQKDIEKNHDNSLSLKSSSNLQLIVKDMFINMRQGCRHSENQKKQLTFFYKSNFSFQKFKLSRNIYFSNNNTLVRIKIIAISQHTEKRLKSNFVTNLSYDAF